MKLVRLPFGEDKDELDDYQMYDGPMESKPLQEFVVSAMPTLAAELDAQTVEPFIGGAGSPGSNPLQPKVRS